MLNRATFGAPLLSYLLFRVISFREASPHLRLSAHPSVRITSVAPSSAPLNPDMTRRSTTSQHGETTTSRERDKSPSSKPEGRAPKRPAFLWFSLFILFLNGSWAVYHLQFETLPVPLSASQAGKRGFSEELAMEHVKALTKLGPHPVGSDSLDLALQYVLATSEDIKKTAHWEVEVDVDFFHAKSGGNRLDGDMFKTKTVLYSDLKHVVLRILPKYLPEAEENTILISSHIDTVFSTEGAGDCSSCVAVMLELGRVMSQWAHGFQSGVIFLFNTGEEEGLNGAHSFITQHPWRNTVRFFVDLEALGIGGKSSIFQSGSDPRAIEAFAKVAKYPSGQIISQDLFTSGAIGSATDFQVYSEVAGLSGLDFAYTDSSAVYHTKNDKLTLLKPGSLQHLGDNMLAFLLQTLRSPDFLKSHTIVKDRAIFFDVLGVHMVAYREAFARTLQNSLILQASLILITSLLMGGLPAVIALGLSALSIVLMWIGSLSLSILVAFVLTHIFSHSAPYIANYWLVFGLFGAPAVIGALTGQHFGFLLLQKCLCNVSSKKTPSMDEVNLTMFEAERWLFKAGCLQWLVILILGNFLKVGSSYIALVWLVSPAFFYGLIEATLTPARLPKQLRVVTLLLGLCAPIIISGGIFIRLSEFIVGATVRFDRNPGSTPLWLGNLIVASFIAALVCLMLVYLLSYIHLSGAQKPLIILMGALFGVTLISVSAGIFPTFTQDTARAVNVVHVVDATEGYDGNSGPVSFISIYSNTPGKLTKELENLSDEDFSCSNDVKLDLVSFTVHYGCRSLQDSSYGWNKLEIPSLHVEGDIKAPTRKTQVLIDTKVSTRWSLAINSEKVEEFTIEGAADIPNFLTVGSNIKGDGWHIVQFAGGKKSPRKFLLTLFWSNNTLASQDAAKQQDTHHLLKLRTDVDRVTPKTARILEKLPSWCSLFGKSTSPYTLAFLANLHMNF